MPDVAAFRRREVGSRALAARELGRGWFASGELEEITSVGWVAEMAVEPPLVKSVIDERRDRPVVVREGLAGHVEAVHARMEDRCGKSTINSRGGKREITLTDMGAHVASCEGKERKERESEHVRGSSRNGNRPAGDTSSVRRTGKAEKEGWCGERSIDAFPFYLSALAFPPVRADNCSPAWFAEIGNPITPRIDQSKNNLVLLQAELHNGNHRTADPTPPGTAPVDSTHVCMAIRGQGGGVGPRIKDDRIHLP